MIKLKDILAESINVELHKVITEKDNQPFMTEEQWSKKWNNVNEQLSTDELIEQLAESITLDETLLEGPDHAFFKNRVYQGIMRKAILKFVMSLTPNSRSTKILRKYFETGSVSPRDVSQIFKEWGAYVKTGAKGATAILFTLLYRSGIMKGAHMLTMPIFYSIINFAMQFGLAMILPNSAKGEQFYIDRLEKGSKYLEKRKEDSSKLKIHIDKTNKRIKQIKSKPGLFKI